MHRLATVRIAFVVALLMIVAACGDDAGTTTTTAVVTTTAATTTTVTAIGGKTPAATVEELIADLYAALNAKDDDAFRALSADGAYHDFFYYSGVGRGIFPGGFRHDEPTLPLGRVTLIEVLGDPLISGDAVAVPVRYTHPNEVDTGFDLLSLARTPDGLLIAGGATLYAAPDLEADAATGEVIAAEALAWNADDVAAVLAAFAENGTMWDDVSNPDAPVDGTALEPWVRESLWFEVEVSSDLTLSGPFAAAATRLTTATDHSDGITIYLVRDGLIVLQAFAQ